jgi:hypothetical protein
LLLATSARAQDATDAEVLFDAGLAKMKEGHYDKACPTIEESFKIEPLPGTLFTLAECWRKAGKLTSALARYEEYLRNFEHMSPGQKAKQRGRNALAQQAVDELKSTIPQLTIHLESKAPVGTVVERDGVRIGGPMLDKPLPVDPGEHMISARAPDGRRVEKKLSLAIGQRKQVDLVLSSTTAAGAEPGGIPEDERAPSSSQKTIGYVVAGVGAAGLVVGAITGILVLGKKGNIDDNCGSAAGFASDTDCNADGKAAADSAQTLATISTIGFAVGIVGLGAGTTLILTAPKPGEAGRDEAVMLHFSGVF